MTVKVIVPYRHDPADLAEIYLAVVAVRHAPQESDWVPAYRDTLGQQLVVWARFPDDEGVVWLRDRDSVRRVRQLAAR